MNAALGSSATSTTPFIHTKVRNVEREVQVLPAALTWKWHKWIGVLL